jgi:hypothetical protein
MQEAWLRRRCASAEALYTAEIFQQVETSGFFMGLEDICIKNDTTPGRMEDRHAN